MPALDRYIALALIKGWLLVGILMLSIFGLLQFVQELEHVGGHYKAVDAAFYVLRTLPQLALDLAPVTGLLGTLVGLANLSRHSELIAMHASGLSPARLFRSVLMPATLMAVSLLWAAEYIAPDLQQQAEEQRSLIRSGRSSLSHGKGLWSNAGLRFFNVRKLEHGRIPTDIDYFEFTPEGKLVMYAHAERADLDQSREWSLINVYKKTWRDRIETEFIEALDMGPFWKKSELPLLSLSTSAMSVSDLYFYARHLKATNQRSERIDLAFWQRIMLPLSLLTMVAMAVPIGATNTTQRTSSLAMRLAIGAIAGILLYLGSQVLQTSGLAMGATPWLLAFIPVAIVTTIAIVLFRRMV